MPSAPDLRRLSPSAKRALELLSKYTALAWPILKTQCELARHDPGSLSPSELAALGPRLATALAKFTSPSKAQAFERDLNGQGLPMARAVESRRTPTANEAELRGFARRALDVLGAFTPLGSSLLDSHCARAGIEPGQLGPRQLELLIPALVENLSRLSSPERAEVARGRLAALVRAAPND